MRAFLILPILLAACTGQPRALSWPDAVRFHGADMAVSFNDGTVCNADIGTAMQGTLSECRYPLHYEVRDYRPSHLARVPQVGGLFQPYAKVMLRAPSGLSWRFETPEQIPAGDTGSGTLTLP